MFKRWCERGIRLYKLFSFTSSFFCLTFFTLSDKFVLLSIPRLCFLVVQSMPVYSQISQSSQNVRVIKQLYKN